jgi:hypothetical protein
MKTKQLIAVVLMTDLIFQSACTKVVPEQTNAAPQQTKAARIREIDAQLANWRSTGRTEDADTRAALKAERSLLAADLGYSTPTVMTVSAPVVAATPVQTTPSVIVAPDSTRDAQNRWQSMAADSKWMDTTYQTQTHGRPVYSSHYYYDANGHRVYY